MKLSTSVALCGSLLAIACGAPRLDTRTFQLKNLEGDEAARLLTPYVFTDRQSAPGAMNYITGSITVRETPDNLDKIARVLDEFDRAKPSVRLHFQIIQADGVPTRDPAIADVEDALRKLFRFKGYRLLAETIVGGAEGSHVGQMVEVEGRPYTVEAVIRDIRGTADSGAIRIEAELKLAQSLTLLQTAVTLRPNQTAVLGNAQLSKPSGTLILTVRPEVVRN